MRPKLPLRNTKGAVVDEATWKAKQQAAFKGELNENTVLANFRVMCRRRRR